MAKGKTRKKRGGGAGEGWLATFADMLALLVCFFAVLFNPADDDLAVRQAIADYFNRFDWGMSLSPGMMQPAGNRVASMPSQTRGRTMSDAFRRAISLFNPEVASNNVKVTQDERGVIVSFASDVFFNPASARLNIESTRHILQNLAFLLNSEEVAGRRYRIEGHTDSVPIDPAGPWMSNWQLSTERALSVLYFLNDFGVSENRAQISGFSSTMPLFNDDTAEGRAGNRRVDIIIIDDAHL